MPGGWQSWGWFVSRRLLWFRFCGTPPVSALNLLPNDLNMQAAGTRSIQLCKQNCLKLSENDFAGSNGQLNAVIKQHCPQMRRGITPVAIREVGTVVFISNIVSHDVFEERQGIVDQRALPFADKQCGCRVLAIERYEPFANAGFFHSVQDVRGDVEQLLFSIAVNTERFRRRFHLDLRL